MPEAPDLKVIVDFLNQRAKGLAVDSARVVKPSVVRPLAGDLAADLPGRTLDGFERKGKFVLVSLSDGRMLAINPMLIGLFQWCSSTDKPFKRTCLALTLSDGHDLRYLDDKQMGMVYYCRPEQVAEIPKFKDGVPDVLDGISYEEFKQRLRPFRAGRLRACSRAATSSRASATPTPTSCCSRRGSTRSRSPRGSRTRSCGGCTV